MESLTTVKRTILGEDKKYIQIFGLKFINWETFESWNHKLEHLLLSSKGLLS
jgi:hypothetical protein